MTLLFQSLTVGSIQQVVSYFQGRTQIPSFEPKRCEETEQFRLPHNEELRNFYRPAGARVAQRLCYGLDDRGSIRGKGKEGIFFVNSSTPALGSTQPSIR
jgi:hypothetical protein